ncbi:ABC transporter permease [Candidatus Bathyarchaeota archaeon CG07_land_8_20_14_0_80_47_9]|nr:MAG: ABC transporter permease [Candidatus Bathyarchaeota archaeon CG07_land_8_20_14_0_80_47_9]
MKESVIAILVLLPSVLLVGYFVYASIGWNVVVSLSNWEGLQPSYSIVGFRRYADLLYDSVFWISLKNNLLLILLFVPSSILLGLFLAILLDVKVRAEGVFRTVYLLPFALSFVIIASLWAWMYDPEVGVLNILLENVGLGFLKSGWVTDSSIAMYCVILALTWQFSGYTMLVFLAGLRSIPESQVMAAEVDGAYGFSLYRRIMIPQLKSSVLAVFVILMVFALKGFDFIYILTGGGPGYSTFVLPLEMFRETFSMTHFAYGAAIATVLFVIVMLIVVPYLYMSSRRREE